MNVSTKDCPYCGSFYTHYLTKFKRGKQTYRYRQCDDCKAEYVQLADLLESAVLMSYNIDIANAMQDMLNRVKK